MFGASGVARPPNFARFYLACPQFKPTWRSYFVHPRQIPLSLVLFCIVFRLVRVYFLLRLNLVRLKTKMIILTAVTLWTRRASSSKNRKISQTSADSKVLWKHKKQLLMTKRRKICRNPSRFIEGRFLWMMPRYVGNRDTAVCAMKRERTIIRTVHLLLFI